MNYKNEFCRWGDREALLQAVRLGFIEINFQQLLKNNRITTCLS
jgi:hypothetical protein